MGARYQVLEGGDREWAAATLWQLTFAYESQGRAATLQRWLSWFTPDDMAAFPSLRDDLPSGLAWFGAPNSWLSVTLAAAQTQTLARTVVVSGPVSAYEEMQLGVELSGQRVTALKVDVGEWVKQGQVLLELDHRTLDSELAQALAARWHELPAGTLWRLHMVGLAAGLGKTIGAVLGPGRSPHRID